MPNQEQIEVHVDAACQFNGKGFDLGDIASVTPNQLANLQGKVTRLDDYFRRNPYAGRLKAELDGLTVKKPSAAK